MDPLGLGSVDNKGIMSLLSAIEQTGDNFDTDPESPAAPIKDDINDVAGSEATEFNQLEGLLVLQVRYLVLFSNLSSTVSYNF